MCHQWIPQECDKSMESCGAIPSLSRVSHTKTRECLSSSCRIFRRSDLHDALHTVQTTTSAGRRCSLGFQNAQQENGFRVCIPSPFRGTFQLSTLHRKPCRLAVKRNTQIATPLRTSRVLLTIPDQVYHYPLYKITRVLYSHHPNAAGRA